ESGDSGLGLWVGNFLGIIDYISVGVNGLVKAFGVLGAMIYNLLSAMSEVAAFIPNILLSIFKPISGVIAKVSTTVLDSVGLGGVADFMREASDVFQNSK